jgi:hypothetical protein
MKSLSLMVHPCDQSHFPQRLAPFAPLERLCMSFYLISPALGTMQALDISCLATQCDDLTWNGSEVWRLPNGFTPRGDGTKSLCFPPTGQFRGPDPKSVERPAHMLIAPCAAGAALIFPRNWDRCRTNAGRIADKKCTHTNR